MCAGHCVSERIHREYYLINYFEQKGKQNKYYAAILALILLNATDKFKFLKIIIGFILANFPAYNIETIFQIHGGSLNLRDREILMQHFAK